MLSMVLLDLVRCQGPLHFSREGDPALSGKKLANEVGIQSYLDALELIRLESPDFVRFLLDNLGLVQRLYCHYFIFNTQSLA